MTILEEPIRDHLMKRIELQNEQLSLEDLQSLKLLGKGMFGTVLLVKHRAKEVYYALKCVNRPKIEKYAIQENLQLERQILLQIDHPLIMKLVKTFKDSKRVYFLQEYIRGMDLFDVLRAMGLLQNADTQFYVGSIILAIQYCHERDIIYRDLKPENIMVDWQGYLKIIDFGTAKVVHGRTYTVVGTPHYMAPEVIVGKGYNTPADLWSIGICMYEFLCGGVPFGDEEEDPYTIYEKILEYRLRYPEFMGRNFPARPLIEQLLNKNAQMRTGGSMENLKNHPWFHDFNWDSLLSRTIRPPYVPQVGDFNKEIQHILQTKRRKNIPFDINKEIENAEASEDEEGVEETSEVRKYKANVPSNWDADF